MACNAGGLLLQPCAPARAIDPSFALSNGPEPRVKNVHAVMATHSKTSGATWTHVLVIGLNKSWSLSPAHREVPGLSCRAVPLGVDGGRAGGALQLAPASLWRSSCVL